MANYLVNGNIKYATGQATPEVTGEEDSQVSNTLDYVHLTPRARRKERKGHSLRWGFKWGGEATSTFLVCAMLIFPCLLIPGVWNACLPSLSLSQG